MTTRDFVRRPRLPAPQVPGGELELQPPPSVPRPVPGGLLQRLMPVVMVVAMLGMVALMVASGGMNNPMTLLFPIMMVFSMVGMLGGAGGSRSKRPAELDEERKDYFRYLAGVRDQVAETVRAQRAGLGWHHPEPGALRGLVGGRRMWERLPEQPDYCHLRIGLGDQRLATTLAVPALGPLEDLEPISAVAMRRFVHTHSVVPRLPTAVSLRGFAAIVLGGDRSQARSAVRAMLLQLCVFHGPDHVRVCLVSPDPDGVDWGWIKWLPHARPPGGDRPGRGSLVFRSLHDLEDTLDGDLAGRGRYSRLADPVPGQAHIVVVLDGGHVLGDERLCAAGVDGVTVLDLTGELERLAARRGLRCEVSGGRIAGHSAAGVEDFGTVDAVGAAEAAATARALAGYRVAHGGPDAGVPAGPGGRGLMSLLGIADPSALSPAGAWVRRIGRDRLRVPIGFDPSGMPVEIDLKESAEGGMGPHGLCIGATGSGKSELLRTLVVSLLVTHGPEQLNLVLVDFKGGATFLGLENAPHVSAVITNLEDELPMVDRMRDALSGEMHRRQELLRAAGNFANVGDYEAARTDGADLAPLPALFIVVDEFSELLSRQPEFAELFVAIGRLGRSLHMHLLLASQRLDEGRLRGLDSHLSYRIGLKTFSGNESRSVLGVPDAYHLPAVPGSGYLKCDSGELIRFTAAYASGPVPRSGSAAASAAQAQRAWAMLFTAQSRTPPVAAVHRPSAQVEEPDHAAPVLLDVVVERLRSAAYRAHEVWLPPLGASPALGVLLDAAGPRRGHGALAVPVALVDRPFDQRRDILTVRLEGAGGNAAIVGGPQSGKSTAARTLVLALAARCSPDEVQVYCLDFGGGALAGLSGVPHVGSVAGRRDTDLVRRTVAELTAIVDAREEQFARLGVESMDRFRTLRAGTGKPEGHRLDRFGDVFLVVDGFAVVRQDFEQLEPQIHALAVRGLSYGVHVVITANRWAELRPALKDMIGTRIELRLGDPADSEMHRKRAAQVPAGRPGRGLTDEGLHLLIAEPRLTAAGDGEVSETADAGAHAVELLCRRWPGRAAPGIRMLPRILRREELAEQCGPGRAGLAVPLGLDEAALAPVHARLDDQPHFMVFADPESGKTSALRTLCRGLVEEFTAEQVKLIVVDYRRTMLGEVEGPHLAGYATTADILGRMVAHLRSVLAERLPGTDVTQAQLRARSWWEGPEIVLVVDDYDLVATASGNPLQPLVDYLSQGKDIGFHLVIARRTGGAARAMFDPVLGRLKDLSTDGVVMNGSRDEGPLIGGARPERMPPGRGMLVTRSGGRRLVQLALSEAAE
ncbi:type VII secretion protein EccCa [Tomitella fengzijianii]|uniref:Type VII secretion protein EccCa n=1 Tax=Tomitella fengzijianii TaxID=2597660 RepID=A0A516X5K9_9ACTN|nr:type VII secretion protein EccCa [Tomitella fengzijianii]QDQ98349.1 type VII secretion protein EccCa [Tomitella fengzijianii]